MKSASHLRMLFCCFLTKITAQKNGNFTSNGGGDVGRSTIANVVFMWEDRICGAAEILMVTFSMDNKTGYNIFCIFCMV